MKSTLKFAPRAAPIGLILLLALVGLGCPGGGESGGGGEPERPDGIVLITVDGLVPADISVYGGPIPMPALERMVRDGRAWNDVWTAVPMTRPAAATYLTGLAPDRHGVLDDLHDSLPEQMPTLATLLTDAGFTTAAFSESSALSPISGFGRGFGIVDPSPDKMPYLARLSPALKPIAETSGNFARWLDSIPQGTRYFAWVHLSRPARAQAFDDQDQAMEAVKAFNDDVDRILDTVIKRGNESSAVVLAGTFGRIGSLRGEGYGLGTSMAEAAIQIPLIVRTPGTEKWRASDSPSWAPDVAVTIARWAEVDLPGAEGVPLQQTPPDRVLLSMSRAPLDQLGWEPIAAARRGSIRLSREGEISATELLDPSSEVSAERRGELEQALARRPVPLGARLPLGTMSEILAAAGVTPNPLPEAGRPFLDPEARSQVVRALWTSRRLNGFGRIAEAAAHVEKVLTIDPQAVQPLVDRGMLQITHSNAAAAGQAKVREAAALYPTHPEVLRWLSVAIWQDDFKTGERILAALRTVWPNDPDLLYDLACARSLDGDLEGAQEKLREAIEGGFLNFDLMHTDGDLRALRESGRLAALLREYR